MSQIYTKEDMWRVAVKEMGLDFNPESGYDAVMLYTPEDVEQLYEALKKAHEEAVDFYERGMIG